MGQHTKVRGHLKAAAEEWPSDLWVFTAGGALNVMRRGPNGERVMLPSGGVDPDFLAYTVNIPSDGGDW